MTTNFFQHIAALQTPGTLKLAITLTATGQLIVSEIFTAACNDKAVHHIKPLTISGTPEEIDEAFFDKITEPVQQVAGLISNMDGHLKSVEAAKLASKMEQDKKTATVKAATATKSADHEMPDQRAEKKKAYDQAIKAIAEHKAACHYEEAIALLPAEADYPEKAADLKKLRLELENSRDQLNKIRLF